MLSIASSVGLFTSASAANAYLTKGIADSTLHTGEYVQDALKLEQVGVNAVRGIGDRGASLVEVERIGDIRIYDTRIDFRAGALFGSVEIVRADAKPALDDALRLAGLLARRLALAQAGRLHGQPVALPETAKAGQPPAGGPALAPMAPVPADLSPDAG